MKKHITKLIYTSTQANKGEKLPSRKRYFLPLLLLHFSLFVLHSSFADAQSLVYDQKCEELITLGKKYLLTKNYKEANNTFILAVQRPENQQSSTSLYYLSLTWYYLGEKENALRRFDQFIKDYPASKYKDDALYHRALLFLDNEHVTEREKGMDQILKLADNAADPILKEQALDAARHYVFDVMDYKFLDLYFLFVTEKHRPLILEGIVHRLNEKNDKKGIAERLKLWKEEGQTLTPYLKSFEGATVQNAPVINSSGELRIAIFLAFHEYVADTAHAVPAKSTRALYFYEGIRFALDKARGTQGPQIRLKVFDSQNDSFVVKRHFDALEEFQPDMIIGDISTSVTQVIGRWAEEHRVVQFIPRNPLHDLVEDKKYVFLVNPSILTHGATMGEYIAKDLGKTSILLLNDKTHSVDAFCEGFKEKATASGATVRECVVSAKFDQYRCMDCMKQFKAGGYSAVYIPLENEENVGLFMSEMAINKVKTQVFGTPAFENFEGMDDKLWTDYKLTYTSYYCTENDTIGYEILKNDFLNDYNIPPQPYNVQGYDLMNYILKLIADSDGTKSLADAIRSEKLYHGISQDIFFNGTQSNQDLSIVLFLDGEIKKIK